MTDDRAPRVEWLDFKKLAPDVNDAILALSQVVAKAGLDKQMLELVKIRASQINGCAFCVQYHILAAGLGVSVDKLNLLAVWREAPIFTDRERAALAWTEALTTLGHGVSNDIYAEVRAAFSETELAYLSSAVALINVWNRFGVAYRWTPPARQKPRQVATS
jgi:AhpD family alkylhydroperoxidase